MAPVPSPPPHLVVPSTGRAPETNIAEQGVVRLDPWLSPFTDSLKRRYAKAHDWIDKIQKTEGGLQQFSRVSTRHTVTCIGATV